MVYHQWLDGGKDHLDFIAIHLERQSIRGKEGERKKDYQASFEQQWTIEKLQETKIVAQIVFASEEFVDRDLKFDRLHGCATSE